MRLEGFIDAEVERPRTGTPEIVSPGHRGGKWARRSRNEGAITKVRNSDQRIRVRDWGAIAMYSKKLGFPIGTGCPVDGTAALGM